MFEQLLTRVEFQMSLLLFVALAGYLIASKFNQSAVIGIIFAGLLIGPSFLGWITYTPFVQSIAAIGAVILLFVVGLEFKVEEIFQLKYAWIAILGVVLPFAGGFYASKLFGYDFGAAVFVGTALTATSIAITANVLREMGKLNTEVAKAIIGAAVIDDILGLLFLSGSQQIASGDLSLLSIGWILLKAVLFLVIGIYLGSKFLSKSLEKLDVSNLARKFPEFVFIFAMMIAFLYAMIAEAIHLSAIVGAFVAGVSIGGVIIRHGKNFHEGAEYLHIIFASLFFVSLGILVDISAFNWFVLLFFLVLTIVAVLTKFIGCYIPARFMGMSSSDSKVVGIGMIPRGEVAMIVALIGLNAGIIGQDIYVSLVLMALATTILAPILLKKMFKPKRLKTRPPLILKREVIREV